MVLLRGGVRSCRASKANGTVYALFPESEKTAMESKGYVVGTVALGWVFANTSGWQPTY